MPLHFVQGAAIHSGIHDIIAFGLHDLTSVSLPHSVVVQLYGLAVGIGYTLYGMQGHQRTNCSEAPGVSIATTGQCLPSVFQIEFSLSCVDPVALPSSVGAANSLPHCRPSSAAERRRRLNALIRTAQTGHAESAQESKTEIPAPLIQQSSVITQSLPTGTTGIV